MTADLRAGQFPKFVDDVYRVQRRGRRLPLPAAHGRDRAHQPLPRRDPRGEATCPSKHVCLHALLPQRGRHLPRQRARHDPRPPVQQGRDVRLHARPRTRDAMLKELIGKACALVEGLGLHYPPVQAGGGRLLRFHGHAPTTSSCGSPA